MARAGFAGTNGAGFSRSGISLTRPLSFSFWLKASGNTDTAFGYTHYVYAQAYDNANPAVSVAIKTSGTVLNLYSSPTGLDSASFTADTSWHQYGVVWLSDDSVYFYRDGAALSNSSLAAGGTTGTDGIGCHHDYNLYVQGSLDQFAAWSVDMRSHMAALGAAYHPKNFLRGMLTCPNLVRGDVTDLVGAAWTTTGTPTTTDGSRVIYPRRKQVVVASAAAPASAVGHYYRNHLMARRRAS